MCVIILSLALVTLIYFFVGKLQMKTVLQVILDQHLYQ